ncbi:YdaU family protein [Massilia timonae]|uniref:YdaU family protein n=1 Tax=Massilia timonae TaxID=47229 RepID=UPI00289A7F17|nr:YdaU family protein [Massilia timonae]
MNFYKRHIGDYIKKAGHLTLLEHGIYARLMDVYYTREAGIPEDKAARLIGARSKDELQALANVLDEFFTLVDGTWTQGRCEEEIGIASEKADKNRANGAKGGRPRKLATEQKPTENPNGYETENHVGFKNNLSQTPDSRLQTKTLENTAPTQPELSAILGNEPTPAGSLSMAMRRFGISSNPGDLRLIALADQGITVDTVNAACEAAKKSKPDAAIPPAYVFSILERWAKDAAELKATGAAAPRTTTRQAGQANIQRLNDRINGASYDADRIIDINDRPA